MWACWTHLSSFSHHFSQVYSIIFKYCIKLILNLILIKHKNHICRLNYYELIYSLIWINNCDLGFLVNQSLQWSLSIVIGNAGISTGARTASRILLDPVGLEKNSPCLLGLCQPTGERMVLIFCRQYCLSLGQPMFPIKPEGVWIAWLRRMQNSFV